MDILAHALWAGAGVTIARRRWPIATRPAAMIVGMAALPDILQLLPILVWWVSGGGSLAAGWAYATALPGSVPALPPVVDTLSHHLHCIMHSAIVAGAVTLLLWSVSGSLWVPLAGWWSHIVIDVFTHSADFYPAPVFYPVTYRGFDGLAWNTPWFLLLNYVVLGAVFLSLRRAGRPDAAMPVDRVCTRTYGKVGSKGGS